jgi:hypothetical protein
LFDAASWDGQRIMLIMTSGNNYGFEYYPILPATLNLGQIGNQKRLRSYVDSLHSLDIFLFQFLDPANFERFGLSQTNDAGPIRA